MKTENTLPGTGTFGAPTYLPGMTHRLRRISETLYSDDDWLISRFGQDNESSLRAAVLESDRLKCWNMVYEEYVRQGYENPDDLKLRYALHDALPSTGSFVAETGGTAVGTVTVFPDSPLGLPADTIYKQELDLLRRAGRRPVEVGRLVAGSHDGNTRSILSNLFDVLSLYSRHILSVTDLIITVNPTHKRFYERLLLFRTLGAGKKLNSVCGAEAVLLRLDLDLQRQVIRWERGEGPKPEGSTRRTFYGHFSSSAEEKARVTRLKRTRRLPQEEFLRRYFIEERPLLQKASRAVVGHLKACYPDYDLGRLLALNRVPALSKEERR